MEQCNGHRSFLWSRWHLYLFLVLGTPTRRPGHDSPYDDRKEKRLVELPRHDVHCCHHPLRHILSAYLFPGRQECLPVDEWSVHAAQRVDAAATGSQLRFPQ